MIAGRCGFHKKSENAKRKRVHHPESEAQPSLTDVPAARSTMHSLTLRVLRFPTSSARQRFEQLPFARELALRVEIAARLERADRGVVGNEGLARRFARI